MWGGGRSGRGEEDKCGEGGVNVGRWCRDGEDRSVVHCMAHLCLHPYTHTTVRRKGRRRV